MSKTSRRCTLALAACLALIAAAAPSTLAAPTGVDFTVAPGTPQSGVAATLTGSATPAPLSNITAWEWDLNGDIATIERTGQSVTFPFPTAGSYQVTLRVTSDELIGGNQASAVKTVTVATRVPNAVFDFNPVLPAPGDEVLFVSTSADPDGDALAHSWDFGDGSFESGTTTPRHAYDTPGNKTVRLQVSDGKGGSDDATREVAVRDPSAPNAAFTASPQNPVENQAVAFTSTSTPSAGQTITAQDWDLDSDGQYDDAEGTATARSFDSRGVYRIALRVRQSNGEVAIAEGSVRVGALPVLLPPLTPPNDTPPNVKSRLSVLSPFPVVRLRGQAYLRRTVVTLLSVRAPRGSLARVRCKGKRCPKVVRRKRSKGKLLRFKTFERSFPAGARLEIFVVHPKRIGKYTSFKLRSGKFPARTDLCVVPGKRKPRGCGRVVRP